MDHATYLANLSMDIEAAFAQLAERCIEYERFEAGDRMDSPLGREHLARTAAEMVERWRVVAGADPAPEEPEPVDNEPVGLSADYLGMYRGYRAQADAL